MRKKLTCFLLAAALLALCACGGGGEDSVSPPGSSAPEPAESPVPAPVPTPVPTPESTPEPETELYAARLDCAYYAEPDFSLEPLGILDAGVEAGYLDESGAFLQVRLDDGQEVWVHGWYLDAADEQAQSRREAEALERLTSGESFRAVTVDGSYTCTANLLNCREGPDTGSAVLYQIEFGAAVEVLGLDSGFYLCRLPAGGLVYCWAGYLVSDATYVQLDGAVDLRVYMPTADFEMLFASESNITGEAMYPAVPLLEAATAEKLAEAQKIFRAAGYSIKIYDAYRPKSAQYKLYDIVQDSRFIANPYGGRSWHQLGRAVDMSLVDMATGQELEMPTPMHTFSTDASRTSAAAWSETARANSDYMTEVMTGVGFNTIQTEWWHFQYEGPGGYMDDNIDFSTLTYVPVSELLSE